MEIPCSVTSDRTLSIYNIDSLNSYKFTENWFSYIIKNINNPSKYIAGDIFELDYLRDGDISWSYEHELMYFISNSPSLIKMKDITVSDSNIKNPADYDFTIESTVNFDNYYDLAISITLPDLYSDVVSYQDD